METKEIRKILPEIKTAWNLEKHKVSDGLQSAIDMLFKCTEALCDRVDDLEKRIEFLERKDKKNSKNSSKPPSSDEHPRLKSKKTSAKNGGRKGHKGYTLKMTDRPDETVHHSLNECPSCHAYLSRDLKRKVKRRQVWDIEFKRSVTEHRVESMNCPGCSSNIAAKTPPGVTSNIQYGSGVRALVNYFQGYQLIPFERVQSIFRDVFELPLCKATAFNTLERGHGLLGNFENKVKEALLNCKVNHADESPIKIDTSRHHLHVLSNEAYTLLSHDKKRGMSAVREIGVLKKFKGILVHDCFSMYFNYGKKHAICNAHLIRELRFVEEIIGHRWAHKMIRFLEDANSYVRELKKEHKKYIASALLESFGGEFEEILGEAERITSKLVVDRGKGAQDPSYNLFKRIKKRQKETLLFMYDFDVPFTNNLAERDLRMVKVQQKISGGWRTEKGAKMYARLRSFISTVQKQGENIFLALKSIFDEDDEILRKLHLGF